MSKEAMVSDHNDAASGDVIENAENVETKEQVETEENKQFKRLLAQKKAKDAQLRDIQEQLENERKAKSELENQRLVSEGKKDELIEKLKQEVELKKGEFDNKMKRYAYNAISTQIKQAAEKEGCLASDKLVNLLDLQDAEVDENFNLSSDYIVNKVTSAKNEMPFFFKKDVPSVKDAVPASGVTANRKKSLNNMSMDELLSLKEQFK